MELEKGGTTSSSGVVCESADGDEICAYDVRILLTGDVSIEGWSADDVDVIRQRYPENRPGYSRLLCCLFHRSVPALASQGREIA